jgi:hypothetical protein
MKLVTFEKKDDLPQIGAMAEDGRTIVALQAGAAAMTGTPSPFFTDMLAFLYGGAEARDQAQAVVEYATGQKPPDALSALTRSACWPRFPGPNRSVTAWPLSSTSSTPSGPWA